MDCVLLGVRAQLELAAICRPRLEPARRQGRGMESAVLADDPSDLPQLQSSPRASPPAGHPVDSFAALRVRSRSEAILLVDLLVALGRCPCRAIGRNCSIAAFTCATRRAATMSGKSHILPPWRRLLVGILGAAVVSVAFF